MKRILLIAIPVIIITILVIILILHNKPKAVNEHTDTVMPQYEVVDIEPVEKEPQVYTDAQGHIKNPSGNAVPKTSMIESGELKGDLYAKSDGKFFGQSGKYISDTLTDLDTRNKLKKKAVEYLKSLNITEPAEFYITEKLQGNMYLLLLVNGDGYFWYFEDTDLFETVDDFYDTMVYRGNITVEEDKILHDCIWYFMTEDSHYFAGVVTKKSDGTFDILNCSTNETQTFTLEELKINAEYGPQFED